MRSSPNISSPRDKTSVSNESEYQDASHCQEYLRLRAGEFGILSRLDDEVNDDNHLVIHRLEEGY